MASIANTASDTLAKRGVKAGTGQSINPSGGSAVHSGKLVSASWNGTSKRFNDSVKSSRLAISLN